MLGRVSIAVFVMLLAIGMTLTLSTQISAASTCSSGDGRAKISVSNADSFGAATGILLDCSQWPRVKVRIKNEKGFWTKIRVSYKLQTTEVVVGENIWAKAGYIAPNAEADYSITFDRRPDSAVQFFVNAAASEDGRPSAAVLTTLDRALSLLGISLQNASDPSLISKALDTASRGNALMLAADALVHGRLNDFNENFRRFLTEDAELELLANIASYFGKQVSVASLKQIFVAVAIIEAARDIWEVGSAMLTGSYAGAVIFASKAEAVATVVLDFRWGDNSVTDWYGGINRNRRVLVQIRRPGSSIDVIPPVPAQTDSNGSASGLTLSGVAPGTYDVYLWPQGFLRQKLSNQNLSSGTNNLFFSMSRTGVGCVAGGGQSLVAMAGDVDGNNVINSMDYSAIQAFMLKSPPPIYSDINGDGTITTVDYSHFIRALGCLGQRMGQASVVGDGGREDSPRGFASIRSTVAVQESAIRTQTAGSGSMSLAPASGTYRVGDTFTVTIDLDSAGSQVDGADAVLRYNPSVLRVNRLNPGSLFPQYPAMADDGTGEINITALASQPTVVAGAFATVEFQATGAGSGMVTVDYMPGSKARSGMPENQTVAQVLGQVSNATYTVTASAPTPTATPADMQPPQVNWVQPVINEQTYHVSNEILQLEASATDDVAVWKVRFYRWDAVNLRYIEIGEDSSAPYQVSLDCSTLNYEWNHIFAAAYDTKGRESERKFIVLYRDNAPPTATGTSIPTTSAVPQPQQPAHGATQGGMGTTLSWTNPAGTTQYHLQVLPANNDGPAINLIRNAETSFTILPPAAGQGNYLMLPGMTYTWGVRTTSKSTFAPEDDPSWGPWSESRTFRTPQPTSDGLAPVSPSDGSTVSAGIPLSLQWRHPNDALFYWEVQVSGDNRFDPDPATATSFVWWNLVHGGQATPLNSWQTPPLQAGTTYFWRVRARVQGDGVPVAWSPTWSFRATGQTAVPTPTLTPVPTATPIPATPTPTPSPVGRPPAAPSNLRATAISSTQIRLEWQDNSDNEAGFYIHNGETIVATVGANTTSYTIGGIAPNTYRCHNVRAFNSIGESQSTDWACVLTLSPPAPTATRTPTPTATPAATATATPRSVTNARLSLIPSSKTVRPGDMFTLDVFCDPGSDEYDIPIIVLSLDLRFSANVLEATAFTAGLGTLDNPNMAEILDQALEPGRARLILSAGMSPIVNGIRKPRVVATITFRTVGTSGSSTSITWGEGTHVVPLYASEGPPAAASSAFVQVQ